MTTKETRADAPKESWGRLIGNVLIVLAVIGGFTFVSFTVAGVLHWLARPESRVAVFLVGSIIGEWAGFGVLMLLGKRHNFSLRDLGWGQKTNLAGIGLGLLVAVIYCAITATNPEVRSHLLQWSSLKLLALAAALTAGIVEETIFRGYIITTLARMEQRVLTQVLVSGLIFALAHIYGFASPTAYLISLGYTILLGIALAIVYLVGRRSLTPVMLSHFLIDAAIEPWLLLSLFTGASG